MFLIISSTPLYSDNNLSTKAWVYACSQTKEINFNVLKHLPGFKASTNAFGNSIDDWQKFGGKIKQSPHSWLDAKHAAHVDHPDEERSYVKKLQVSPNFCYVNGDIVGGIAWMARHWMRSILRKIDKLPVITFDDGTKGKVNPINVIFDIDTDLTHIFLHFFRQRVNSISSRLYALSNPVLCFLPVSRWW